MLVYLPRYMIVEDRNAWARTHHWQLKLKKFDFPYCDRSFTKRYHLRTHLRGHQEQSEEEKYKCELCGVLFKRAGDRTRHEGTRHSGMKHVCGGCSRNFYSADTLSLRSKSSIGLECARKLGIWHSWSWKFIGSRWEYNKIDEVVVMLRKDTFRLIKRLAGVVNSVRNTASKELL